MLAITTKFIGPTETRGARIKASTESGVSVTIGYPHEFNTDKAHRLAALALCEKMGWHGQLAQGGIKNGYVFVWVNETYSV